MQVGDRTRLVLNLNRSVPYETRLDGKYVFITVSPEKRPPARLGCGVLNATEEPVAATAAVPIAPFAISISVAAQMARRESSLTSVRRTPRSISVAKGANLVVDLMKNASLPEPLRRRLDVTDFGTRSPAWSPKSRVATYR